MTTENDIQDPSWIELLKAFELGLIHDGPPPVCEYRFYYDLDGSVKHGTTTVREAEESNYQFPYIVVNEEEYNNIHKYKVKNGRLCLRQSSSGQLTQLVKSDTGFRVVKNHAVLLLEQDEQYTDVEYYDYRNN